MRRWPRAESLPPGARRGWFPGWAQIGVLDEPDGVPEAVFISRGDLERLQEPTSLWGCVPFEDVRDNPATDEGAEHLVRFEPSKRAA